MSYDVSLTGLVAEPKSWNMTSNVVPMWQFAGADLATFDGKRAGDVLPFLESAIAHMEKHPDTYRAMNPPNGWGDYDSCLGFLRDLAAGFAEQPRATVRVDR